MDRQTYDNVVIEIRSNWFTATTMTSQELYSTEGDEEAVEGEDHLQLLAGLLGCTIALKNVSPLQDYTRVEKMIPKLYITAFCYLEFAFFFFKSRQSIFGSRWKFVVSIRFIVSMLQENKSLRTLFFIYGTWKKLLRLLDRWNAYLARNS